MKEIQIEELVINPCLQIGEKWLLISSGNKDDFNMMTASWGEIGALWGHGLKGRPTFTIFVRPCRYTDKYINRNDIFTISFFGKEYKDDLVYLGSHSGKDENKILKTKFTPYFINNYPMYKEASLTLICKKIYKGKIDKKGFIDKTIIDNFYTNSKNMYDNESYHNVYVGEILKIYQNLSFIAS